MSYQYISPQHKAYLAKITTDVEPSSDEEIITYSRWRDAMNQELHALKTNET